MQEQEAINLNDIANAVRIIDTASERGAFRGPELSGVGQLRDRFAQALEAAQKAQEEQEAAAGPANDPDAPKDA